MSMLIFLPWCSLDKEYSVGDVILVPFEADKPCKEADLLTHYRVRTILLSYKNLNAVPVRCATLVRMREKKVLEELMRDDQAHVYECVSLAAFAALANRGFFETAWPKRSYWTNDHFVVVTQQFKEEPYNATLDVRKLDGEALHYISTTTLSISIPSHIAWAEGTRISLDENLLKSLEEYRKKALPSQWGRWRAAISCFNYANTDDPLVLPQTRWIFLCSAFEQLLDAKSKKSDVARSFSATFMPETELGAAESDRKLPSWDKRRKPLRYEWMQEFYHLRGDFAHGRLRTRREASWEDHEHLFLAAVAFPLLSKQLLAKENLYELTTQERADINVFERVAAKKFMIPQAGHAGGEQWIWKKLRQEENDRL